MSQEGRLHASGKKMGKENGKFSLCSESYECYKKIGKEEKVTWQRKTTLVIPLLFSMIRCTACKLRTTFHVCMPRITTQFVTGRIPTSLCLVVRLRQRPWMDKQPGERVWLATRGQAPGRPFPRPLLVFLLSLLETAEEKALGVWPWM